MIYLITFILAVVTIYLIVRIIGFCFELYLYIKMKQLDRKEKELFKRIRDGK